MPKKVAILFFTIFLTGIFLPLLAQAVAGTYFACPPNYPFYDKDNKWCCQVDEDGNPVDCNATGSVPKKTICYEGFVPCGLGKPTWGDSSSDGQEVGGECQCVTGSTCRSDTGVACQFCHFFVLIDGILDFLLFKIVPFLAVGIIVIGGIMFYIGGTKPDMITRGRKLIIGVVIGLFLIYGAFMLTSVFLSVLGVTEWTQLGEWTSGGPFRIPCEIY